jgi:hypothetical protein
LSNNNDDNQKTQAIPDLHELLKSDRTQAPPDEEEAAPTEAIDFAALVASGKFPDMEMDAAPPKPNLSKPSAPPEDPWGAPSAPSPRASAPPPMDPMPSAPPPMNNGGRASASGNGPTMGGPSSSGRSASAPPPQAPPSGGGNGGGGSKKIFIVLGIGALFLFCCCPGVLGGLVYGNFLPAEVSSKIPGMPAQGGTEPDKGEDLDKGPSEEDGDEGGGDQASAVADMTPDKLEAKVKELGWGVVGEPTKLNDSSITIPIVKGTTGGAVSLNDFSGQGGSIATNSFVDTMKKNDGCALAVNGDKVLSVLMPGNKAEADKLLEELTK